MIRLYFIQLACLVPTLVPAQRMSRAYIPHSAIFYNSRWQGVASADKASYYRVLVVDDSGRKMFYDYFITGQLQAEKHYISLSRQNDRNTVLDGVCRTFHKSGRVESVMQYRNGKADGRALSFFPNGNIGMKLSYRNGVLDGPCYTYNENGHLEYTTLWRNGAKVSETRGGKDHYIDKTTNEDAFCERYRHDEALIMAQSKTVSKRQEIHVSELKGKKGNTGKTMTCNADCEDVQMVSGRLPAHAVVMSDRKNTHVRSSKAMTKEERLAADVRYPDGPAGGSAPVKVFGVSAVSGIPPYFFSFPDLYSLLNVDGERMRSAAELAALGRRFRLDASQTIDGYGTQKEIIFHHNMTYDVQNGRDRVTGSNPRQIGFFGSSAGGRLSIDRINLFTGSEDEMLFFARQAVEAGYKVLGGGEYRASDGNFILEHGNVLAVYGEREVIVTFTHQPSLYAGLYHIQMDVR